MSNIKLILFRVFSTIYTLGYSIMLSFFYLGGKGENNAFYIGLVSGVVFLLVLIGIYSAYHMPDNTIVNIDGSDRIELAAILTILICLPFINTIIETALMVKTSKNIFKPNTDIQSADDLEKLEEFNKANEDL